MDGHEAQRVGLAAIAVAAADLADRPSARHTANFLLRWAPVPVGVTMRFPISLVALALLAGCSIVPAARDAWNWDPSAPQDRSRLALSPEQLGAITSRVAELQIQRTAIRSRISAEPDIRVRQQLYAQLHQVGRQLSPLERRLTAAAPAR